MNRHLKSHLGSFLSPVQHKETPKSSYMPLSRLLQQYPLLSPKDSPTKTTKSADCFSEVGLA